MKISVTISTFAQRNGADCIAIDVESARWVTLTLTVAKTPSDALLYRGLRRRTSLAFERFQTDF
jgi:hypothetical protein